MSNKLHFSGISEYPTHFRDSWKIFPVNPVDLLIIGNLRFLGNLWDLGKLAEFSEILEKCSSLDIRDATQSPGKSPIFSPLKIGGGRGVNPDFGKIETKYSNRHDRASVNWEN